MKVPPKKLVWDIALGLVILAVYFIGGKLGLRLAFVNASATAVWPPTGIALAALLLFGFRFWPVIFLGAFLVNLTTAGSIITSLGIALGNTLEATVGAYLVKKYAAGLRSFLDPRNIFKFSLFAGVISTALAASIGVTTLYFGHLAPADQLGKIWLTWWLGDMGGASIVGPLIIIWSSFKWPKKIHKAKVLEMVICLAALLFIGWIIFGPTPWAAHHYSLDFLLIPLMLWVALRFSRRQTISAVLILSALAIWGTLNGFGPFTQAPDTSLLLLQAFLVTASMGTLTVSALIMQQEEMQGDLVDYSQHLDEEKIKDEALLASIGEGIVATDEAGQIILVNKAFQDMLGWKESEIAGKYVNQALKMQDEQGQEVPPERHPLNAALSSGEKVTADYYLVRKDGSKFFAGITSAPIFLKGKIIGAIKVFRDMSKEKEIDKTKSEFVSIASHQLRTPLTVIKWHAARLLETWDDSSLDKEDQKKYIRQIYVTNQRMVDLVSAILNVSKIDLGTLAVEPEHIHLEDVADSVINELEQQAHEKGVILEKNFEGPLPSISADPGLMRIVFQNLLTNSIKYTPRGGKVTCSIKFGQNSLLLCVADTGVGIPKKDYAKIYGKFFRTDAARHIDPNGNGLGMYITKAIIDRAEGKIWFESQEGLGTKFYVSIPLTGMKKKEGVKGLTEIYS